MSALKAMALVGALDLIICKVRAGSPSRNNNGAQNSSGT
jgi:hypothetical protein